MQHAEVDRAFEVHGLPTRSDLVGLLDDGHVEPVAVQPVRECWSGDARTQDEDAGVLHRWFPNEEPAAACSLARANTGWRAGHVSTMAAATVSAVAPASAMNRD